ncbi:MAG: methyl-accepting chemotaxis protein [Candidatus Kariarchaeaceae archaeon]
MLEVILPAFLVINPIILAINGKELNGLNLSDWLSWYSLVIPSIVMLTLATIKVIGINDFRFKLYIHTVVMGLATTVMGLMIPGSGFFDMNNTDNKPLVLVTISTMGITLMAVLIGAIFSIYALTNPFTEEVESFTKRIKAGELTAQIDNPIVLTDSVFGPPSKFINEITDYSNLLLSDVADTSSLIVTTSEQLSVGAEEVHTSAEEVSSTSQAMSHGATQQTEMINFLVNQMKDADKVINDIVQRIQNNTDAVSQIALQTNILALNAGIEASRAGDYGRGFAVVAENVRKLSDQSKMSAEDISQVVDTISTTLQESFGKMQNSIMNIASVSEETAASAEEVAAVTEEMTSSMEQVSSLAQGLSKQAEKSNNLLSELT